MQRQDRLVATPAWVADVQQLPLVPGQLRRLRVVVSVTPSDPDPRPDPYEDELAQGFGQGSVSGEDRPVLSHDPFGSDEEHQAFLEDLHLSRGEGR